MSGIRADSNRAMPAHTPGPWRLQNRPYENGDPYFHIDAGCGFYPLDAITRAREGGFGITGILSEADARLIAAAPELLEAVKFALRVAEGEGWDAHMEVECNGTLAVRYMRDAIAKAQGSSPATSLPEHKEES